MHRKSWPRLIRAASACPTAITTSTPTKRSVDTLKKYRAHVQKMFVLAGEPEAQAGQDADIVLELETAMAKAQMDNIKRRDPKNINNRMSVAQVRELTPSIQWDVYLKAVNAPASDHFIVTSPDFFSGRGQAACRASPGAIGKRTCAGRRFIMQRLI